MTGIVDWAIQQTRLMMTLLAFLFLLGLVSYINLPKEADPDIPIPFVYVGIPHPGISPEDAERLILRPMETKLRTIEGLEELNSFAQQGYAGVGLKFDVNFDQDQALSDVREKVDEAKSELPEDTEEPIVQEFNASLWPVVTVIISGNMPERSLRRIAEELETEIEALPSVLDAEIIGAREELLEVIIDPAKLESYGVTANELFNAVSLNNRLVAAGSLNTREGQFAVKVPGLFETRSDVLGLPIKVSDGTAVTLGDVADIRRSFVDAERFARFNAQPAVAVEVTKRIGENIVDTIGKVREVVDRESARWPETVSVDYIGDQSVWINRSLSSLEQSIMLAILLVMIVVVAALGLRSGMLVGFAIPTSFFFAFLFLALGGFTINMMVMFGMILAVGMIVDGGIIIVEYADRKMSEGLSPRDSYSQAARRMFWPIIASAATTVAAFSPMLFWPGVSGKFMEYFPITVIFVLTASTLVALIFLPVVGAIVGKPSAANAETLKALAASETGDVRALGGMTGAYARLVGRVIQRPGQVIAVAVATLIGVMVIFSSFGRGVEFFVEQDPEQAQVLVQARGNLSAEQKRDLVVEVEDRILDVPGLKGVFTSTGSGSQPGFGNQAPPADTIGSIALELMPYGQRPPGKDVLDAVRAAIADMPGLHAEVREQEGGPPVGKDVNVELTSRDYTELQAATTRVREFVNRLEGLRDIEDSRPLPGIEWQVSVDRAQAGIFGADITQVGNVVQLVTNGIKVGEYRPDDARDEIDIRVRFPLESRTLEQIGLLKVPTTSGLVPISNFVTFEPTPQVNKIERRDGERVQTVKANVETGVLAADKVAEIEAWLAENPLPKSVRIAFRGANEEADEAGAFLTYAGYGALLLMFIILMLQFNNFWHCAIILSAVVMSTVGVMLGMLVMNQTFSIIMTGTGIVALAGIIVNNNIVLVDTFHYLVSRGMAPMEAIVRTGAQRLRPVFLTTFTTMCGLFPLMFEFSVNFFDRSLSFGAPETKWWVQLATAVVFGLGFATVLTLLVTPALIALPYRIAETKRGFVWLLSRAAFFPYFLVFLPLWHALFGKRRKPEPAE